MNLHDKTFEGGVWETFPPIPGIILKALRWLYMHKMEDWWKFAPCDLQSQPRELPFADDVPREEGGKAFSVIV